MPVIILTSFAKPAQALSFSKKLVAQRLAACVSILPGTKAVYRWKGKDKVGSEVLLMIKTSTAKRAAVEKFISENHTYELAEVLTLSVTASKAFGVWINDSTK
jgi:periplasmic divalent cation tolerance protein